MNQKTKNILIIVGEEKYSAKSFTDIVRKNFADKKVQIDLVAFSDLSFELTENEIDIKIKNESIRKYNLVYIRKAGTKYTILANSLGIGLKHLGIPFYDSVFGEYGAKGNKLRGLVQLCVSGVVIPKTIYFCNADLTEHYDYIANTLGVPFVAKDIGLQRGKGVFLINSLSELAKLPYMRGSNGKCVYLFQQLLEKKNEYRIVVLDESVGVWYEKFATDEGEFRYNTSLGATEVFLDKTRTPKRISKPAIQAAIASKTQIAGVDIIVEKGTEKVYILEVNRGPGLTYDETISYEFKAVAEFLEGQV